MATHSPALSTSDDFLIGRSESQLQMVVRRFLRHRLAVVSLVILVIFLVASFTVPLFVAPEPIRVGNDVRFLPPLTADPRTGDLHLLGTDNQGRDYFIRLIYAARVSLTVALVVVTISTLIGITLGLLAGYFGGWVDMAIRNFYEFVSTFPLLIILLILTSILLKNEDLIRFPEFVLDGVAGLMAIPSHEAPKVTMVMMALALLRWTTTARLMRGMVLSVREQLYIESSRALGASTLRIILIHVFLNAVPPLIVDFTLSLNDTLVLESSLSFLGFGIQEPTPTWGNMLSVARSNMLNYWWIPLIPGMPILICSLAINYVGDGLRDALDPRQKL